MLCLLMLSSCTKAVDNANSSTVSFSELPKAVQDTILYWTQKQADAETYTNSDSLINIGEGIPNVISFDEKYTLESTVFGPWGKCRILTRLSDGKVYKLSRDIPIPIVIRQDSLIVPTDYNILTIWDPLVKWKVYKLH